MEAPLLSFIVLSFRRFAQTTGPCLETLLPQCEHAELLLVDNGSDDGAAQACADFVVQHPKALFRFLPLEGNLGFGGGMNAGVAQTSGEWVVLVNSDTLFPEGAVAALERTLSNVAPNVALVGPVTNSAGNGQCLPLPDADLPAALAIGAQAMKQPTGLLAPTYRTDFFCVAVRRSAWEALHGLDPIFGLGYYEDFDFSLRARAAGFEQLIAEDVFIVHAGSATFSAQREEQRQLLKRNRAILQRRHRGVRFEHERDGNLRALHWLLHQAELGGWTSALRERAQWRWAALRDRRPKSLFKRIRWRLRIAPLVKRLRQHGLHHAYPLTPR